MLPIIGCTVHSRCCNAARHISSYASTVAWIINAVIMLPLGTAQAISCVRCYMLAASLLTPTAGRRHCCSHNGTAALVCTSYGSLLCELQDCKTNNCYSQCQKTCPVKVDGNKCKKFGADAGYKIGKDSCATTQKYCAGSKSVGGARRGFQVTLTQVRYHTGTISRPLLNWL